ncbi:nitric-oxide reductase [Cutibacterium acnes JCM 18909]|nr:nitric-oxide reductase [Cutibacterium acnes JCM 18909]
MERQAGENLVLVHEHRACWMVFVTLLPLGILQLYHSVDAGYFEARQLNYITEHRNVVLEWLRMPGDLVFIIGGVLPFLWMTFQGLMHHRRGGPSTSCRWSDSSSRRPRASKDMPSCRRRRGEPVPPGGAHLLLLPLSAYRGLVA